MSKANAIIALDGSQGEGGGQILRSSLALSICTGQPLNLTRIRAGRRKPGLMRQHLTAVKAAMAICGGRAEGANVGSTELAFYPGPVQPGDYQFAVGTAGSSCLVFQTVLPALMLADASSTLTLEGGTHNPLAPSFDFLNQVFFPLLAQMGVTVTARLERYGFYPAGGGRWTARIQPAAKLMPLQLTERGELVEQKAVATRCHLPGHIAERELRVVAERLGWGHERLEHRQVDNAYGSGNWLEIIIRSETVTELCTSIGQHGVSAERVAANGVREAQRYIDAGVPVGEHLADQLLLPLALAGGGEFVTLKPSSHTLTNIAVIEKFLPVRFAIEETGEDCYRIAAFTGS